MQRFFDHAVGRAERSNMRFVVLATVAALLLLAISPALASAAPQTLTVKLAGTGTGKVTSSPAGIDCGATCAAPFTEGSTVVLSGAPGTNTAAVSWSGCAKVNLENECSVTMSAAKTVTATFNLLERPLTVKTAGGGTGKVTSSPAGIDCGSTCSASFVKGTAVTLTGTPGAKTLAPTWSGCESVDAEAKCVVTMSAAKTVTATFDLTEYPLTVNKSGSGTGKVTSSPAGIDCGATCSSSFATGTLVTLTGTPGANTAAVKWSGCDSVDGEGKCLVTASAAKEVTATFSLVSHLLTVSKEGEGSGTVTSSPAGIKCGSTCSASFTHGTAVMLSGEPDVHSEDPEWSGCDTVTIEDKCLVSIGAARSVTASFEPELPYREYTVSVQMKGTGKGSVASVPGGIECGEDCSEKYLRRTRVMLIATPEPGSVFLHWSGGSCSGTAPCEKTINSTRRVNAVFGATGTRTLTIAKSGNGGGTVLSKRAGIDCGTTCSAEVNASTRVSLKAVAAVGSTFAGWSGACSGVKTCKLLMNEARNVTANFESTGTAAGTLVVEAAKARGSKAMLRVLCKGGPCVGTLKLVARIRNAQGQVKGLVIAKAPFNLAAGASTTLEARLSQRALSLLRNQGRLRVRLSGSGVQGRGVKLTRSR